MPTRKLIAGNWKMNGLLKDGQERAAALATWMKEVKGGFDMLLCPPATLLQTVGAAIAGSGLWLGGQDCHEKNEGAHTGDISPAMLKDIGCSHAILGHSERRQNHKETSPQVAAKAAGAHAAGLVAIICVGETEAERNEGRAQEVVGEQLRQSVPAGATAQNTVIAYEPVWAIGTGKTATADDIAAMHAFIRERLAGIVTGAEEVRILYGGSVKGANAAEILHIPHVDGVLVGGASLKVEEFRAIAEAA